MDTRQGDKSTAVTRAIGNLTGWLGSLPAIALSIAVVLVWFIVGFVARQFSNDTYQLLINTGTTIVTFLMVFVIQNTQNRDGRAMQTKIDAQSRVLCAVAEHLGLDSEQLDELVGLEDAPEQVIKEDQDIVRADDETLGSANAAA